MEIVVLFSDIFSEFQKKMKKQQENLGFLELFHFKKIK